MAAADMVAKLTTALEEFADNGCAQVVTSGGDTVEYSSLRDLTEALRYWQSRADAEARSVRGTGPFARQWAAVPREPQETGEQ